ncbi:hypothetical protein N7457_005484 [Penicillium paradoxum]|uniref:uncharacterized protein n=1 Tax=Penicillium paradoxum TaxID=176176 RepID=UPI002547431A|nr:uncharacterized protein N7457_005484 [Penicillium paradoxum]KAJ5780324.1 hypothetical protein N7457_005484 [Penicillium paradoxum]
MTDKTDLETVFKSEAYASTFKRGEIVTRTFGELLVDQSKVVAESKANPDQSLVILDNACGTGVISSTLNAKLDDTTKARATLTCGDISSVILTYTADRMKQEGWENVETRVVDARDSDLPSDHYSHVFTAFAYMAIPDSIKALDETIRILQPGGTIAFSTWIEPGWIALARRAIEGIPGNLPFPETQELLASLNDGEWYSKPWIESQLENRGFQDVDVRVSKIKLALISSVFVDMAMMMIPSMTKSFWTDKQREEHADKLRPALEKYAKDTFGDGDIETEWVALLSTARQSC